jgi:hypothetical protein
MQKSTLVLFDVLRHITGVSFLLVGYIIRDIYARLANYTGKIYTIYYIIAKQPLFETLSGEIDATPHASHFSAPYSRAAPQAVCLPYSAPMPLESLKTGQYGRVPSSLSIPLF